jgi:hypothetical protein
VSAESVFWVVVALAVAVAAFFIIRYRLYLREIAEHGWRYNSTPQLGNFLTYQAPPFGLGFKREVDDLISGATSDGRRFDCFEYRYAGAGPVYRRRALAVELPAPMQTVFVSGAEPRRGIWLQRSQSVVEGNGYQAVAANRQAAQAVLAQVAGALQLPDGEQLDLSIDGNRVVITPASKDPDELAALLGHVTPLVASLAGLAASFPAPPPVAGFSFYGHPEWVLVGRDKTLLTRYPVATGGFGHSTEQAVRAQRDGIRMDSFLHNWKTTETRVVPNGRGGMTTQTYVASHQEVVLGFTLPFALPQISVNGARLGEKAEFESEAFNDVFKVRAANLKFASDVIHPRTMEWMLANRPVSGWTVFGQTVRFHVGGQDMFIMAAAEETLRGFLGRIPRFVWDDLGIPVPPFLVE